MFYSHSNLRLATKDQLAINYRHDDSEFYRLSLDRFEAFYHRNTSTQNDSKGSQSRLTDEIKPTLKSKKKLRSKFDINFSPKAGEVFAKPSGLKVESLSPAVLSHVPSAQTYEDPHTFRPQR